MKKGTIWVKGEELKTFYKMFEAGCTIKDIAKATGRCEATVKNMKKRWRNEKETNKVVAETNKIESTNEEVKTDLVNSDYAKAKQAGDPRWTSNSLNVRKTISIESSKTGFRYRMADDSDMIAITTPEGSRIEIDMKKFEAFADESVDVYIEMCSFNKKK